MIVNDIAAKIRSAERFTIAGAPEGVDALVLAQRALAEGILHVARDDARMAELAELVEFFAPGLDIITVPAWDCLPYDRTSPALRVMAERLAALNALQAKAKGPQLLVTTENAATQRQGGETFALNSAPSATRSSIDA